MHADHEHDHNGLEGGCAACAYLMSVTYLCRLLFTVMAYAVLVFECASAIRMILKRFVLHTGFFTLVHVKIRLDN